MLFSIRMDNKKLLACSLLLCFGFNSLELISADKPTIVLQLSKETTINGEPDMMHIFLPVLNKNH
jgi:hypothetical protein